jgi:S-adenosylmethionine:tRNA ribosyltransferase-isomerase
MTFAEVIHVAGVVPLPPYIKREPEKEDEERYQTIYATSSGSVAAPTSGLHFTPRILEKLEMKSIQSGFVTLHIGAGTFKPVSTERMETHAMHAEFIYVTKHFIETLFHFRGKHITAVGTTSLRTIESLYWAGVKILQQPKLTPDDLFIHQWEAYDLPAGISVKNSLEALLGWMDKSGLDHLMMKTELLIAPGYEIKIPDALITNFHQPQSTLLLLVAAFIGNDWKKVYRYALDNQFRFLSYGDSCLFFRPRLYS